MSRIIIVRTFQKANSMRDYEIYLNGTQVASLSNGDNEIIEVEPGKHRIYSKIDWSKTKEIKVDIDADQTISLLCGSRLSGWKAYLALFYMFSKDKFIFLEHYEKGKELAYQEKVPEDIREKGMLNFIIKVGILGWGIPVGIFVFLVNLMIHLRDLTLERAAFMFLSNMTIFAIAGIIFGLIMWAVVRKK